MKTRTGISDRVAQLLSEAEQVFEEARIYFESRGIILDRPEWLTVEKYCQRFDVENPELVYSWVDQGLIAKENFRFVEELDGRLMMKAIPHNLTQNTNS